MILTREVESLGSAMPARYSSWHDNLERRRGGGAIEGKQNFHLLLWLLSELTSWTRPGPDVHLARLLRTDLPTCLTASGWPARLPTFDVTPLRPCTRLEVKSTVSWYYRVLYEFRRMGRRITSLIASPQGSRIWKRACPITLETTQLWYVHVLLDCLRVTGGVYISSRSILSRPRGQSRSMVPLQTWAVS